AGPVAGGTLAVRTKAEEGISFLLHNLAWLFCSPELAAVQRTLSPAIGLTRATPVPTASTSVTSIPSTQHSAYDGCFFAEWISRLIPIPLPQPAGQREPYFTEWM